MSTTPLQITAMKVKNIHIDSRKKSEVPLKHLVEVKRIKQCLRIINQLHHLVKHPLRCDFRECLLTILCNGFKQRQGQVLNPGALQLDPLLYAPYEFNTIDPIMINHVTEFKIRCPIGLIQSLRRRLLNELIRLVRALEKLLHLKAHGAHSSSYRSSDQPLEMRHFSKLKLMAMVAPASTSSLRVSPLSSVPGGANISFCCIFNLLFFSHFFFCLLPDFPSSLGNLIKGTSNPSCPGENVPVLHNGRSSIANSLLRGSNGRLCLLRNLKLLVHFFNLFIHNVRPHTDFLSESNLLVQSCNFGCGSGSELVLLIKSLGFVNCIFAQDKTLGQHAADNIFCLLDCRSRSISTDILAFSNL
nr:hypothetical protein D0Y65_017857 [Ipomoea batatas]GMC98698.1 hypothetical protein D0Y65_017857 [Ipomoea batatas]